MWLGYCICTSRLVVIMLLSWLRGWHVGCTLGGFNVGWHACVGLWRFVGRRWYVGFVRGRVCFSNRGVWGGLGSGWRSYGCGRCRWLVLMRSWVYLVGILGATLMGMFMLCSWAVRMRTMRLMGPLRCRSWLWEVDCRGYSGICVLCRSTYLAHCIIYLGFAILRIGVVECLGQYLIYWARVFVGSFWDCVVCCAYEWAWPVILRMMDLCLRVYICHGVCLVVCFLMNIRLCRLVCVV